MDLVITKPEPQQHADDLVERRSLIETWTEVVNDAACLLQLEVGLAREETAANVKALGRGTFKVIAGGLMCMTALIFAAVAAVVGLAKVVGLLWALLAVALGCVAIGLVLIWAGRSTLSETKILPDESIHRVSADLKQLSARGRDALPL